MDGKLTLITPPDIFENNNTSVLFIHLNDQEQTTISKWLADSEIEKDINLYVYDGEPNMNWIFYAMSRCEYKYIDLTGLNYITQALAGYILAKKNVYYKVDDENIAAVYSHINNNRVNRVETFLESILVGQ